MVLFGLKLRFILSQNNTSFLLQMAFHKVTIFLKFLFRQLYHH